MSTAGLSQAGSIEIKPYLFGGNNWYYPHFSNQLGVPAAAIRQGDWKLILHFEKQEVELYNRKMDMSESKELKSIHPEKAEELYGLLLNWFADTHANLPISKEPESR